MIEIPTIVYILSIVLGVWISHAIAKNKEQYAICLLLGLLFGPLGWIIALLFPDIEKKNASNVKIKSKSIKLVQFIPCPYCGKGLRKSSLRKKDNICQWCGCEFDIDKDILD